MDSEIPFNPLRRFAEIELLVSKVYFRFSHLFLYHPELRDFWWQMAKDEEQHSSILLACEQMIENYPDEAVDPSISQERADQLKTQIKNYLSKGTPSITVEEAFKIALEIENSEIDAIYSKLLHLGGPKIAKTMENLGVPASVQRQKLKSAIVRFCKDPGLLASAGRM
jgi:rubrerythrin